MRGDGRGVEPDRPEAIASAEAAWCSCGKTIASCRFWGPLLPELDGGGGYAPFLARFRQCYPGRVCIDSSKNVEAMQITHPSKFLHVIRDVRGWSISSGRRGPRAYLSWKRDNERRIDFLNREKYDWLLVSYDELGLRPEPSLRRICNFLGLSYIDQMLRYGQVEHHGIKTSMKEDPRKMDGSHMTTVGCTTTTHSYRVRCCRGSCGSTVDTCTVPATAASAPRSFPRASTRPRSSFA
jgi:hypothetical protein